MKALSLWQPHAAAIALGLKTYETRDWPTRYRGPLAIHAAKRLWDDAGEWHTLAKVLMGRRCADLIVAAFPAIDVEHQKRAGNYLIDRVLAFGAVVCTVDLVDCVRTSELRGQIGDAEFWGDFSDGDEHGNGRYAFRLENLRILAKPLPWRGAQRFFEVDLGVGSADASAPVEQLQQQLALFGGM